jgi:competence protein ComEC
MTAAFGFALMGAVARRLRWAARFDPEPLQWASAAVCALGCAAVSGFGTPAQRALVFIGAWLALHALGRRSAWGRVWWCAAALVLAADSAALFDLGPQLSFGVTAALATARFDVGAALRVDADAPADLDDASFSHAGARRWRRVAAGMRGLLDASAVALAASALVLSLHGRPTSVWSLCANFVAVPLTGAVLLPSALVAAVLAWATPEWTWVQTLLRALAWGPAVFEGLATEAAAWVGPLAEGARPEKAALMVAVCALVIVLRTPRTWLRVAAACACVTALGWGPIAAPPVDAPAEIVMLDVGQGDSVLLRAGEAAVLIDAGWASPMGGFDAGRHVVVPALKALGVHRLDLIVLTHGDLDHRGGAAAVLDAMPVEAIWVPQSLQDAPVFASLERRAEGMGVRWMGRARGEAPVTLGEIELEVLWPPRTHGAVAGNEASLVLRARVGASHVLLMGDAGFATERALLAKSPGGAIADALSADVLKVGHHGSATASSSAFLRAVAPRVALVSAGCGVGRALPHPATFARLSAAVGSVLWTGRDGALRIALDRNTERAERARPAFARREPVWPARRCQLDDPGDADRRSAAANAAADADRGKGFPAPVHAVSGRPAGTSGPVDRPATLPLWGASRRVVAPRERRRRRWGRTRAARVGRRDPHRNTGGSHRWAGESSGPAA